MVKRLPQVCLAAWLLSSTASLALPQDDVEADVPPSAIESTEDATDEDVSDANDATVDADNACPAATDVCCCPDGCCTCDTEGCSSPLWDALTSDTLALDCLRNRPCGDWLTYSVGGEFRVRYLDERNRLRPPGPQRTNYDQWRFTPFLEANYDGWLTGHVRAIDAATFNEDLPILPIDENRADLLLYYVDLKLWEDAGRSLSFRYGRQFLKYGSQYLVSPLPWANTYRNFEGYRLYYQSESWDVDGFAVNPVNGAAGHIFRPRSFDTPDQSRWFSGVYASYKGMPTGPVDFYWLWLKEDERRAMLMDGNRHTLGARWNGNVPVKDCCGETVRTWHWNVEGAGQFGEDDFVDGTNQDVTAGFFSLLGGHTWNQVPWSPSLQGIFYWGTGDDRPFDGEINTFNTLFPFGHYYWGLIDNFNGQNLIDYAAQVTVKPTDKLTCLAAWHWFDKQNRNDFIYNIAGVPVGPRRTDRHIGNELDLLVTYAVNANLSLQWGYFWFWYGDAVDQTALARPDAHQFYFMTTWGF